MGFLTGFPYALALMFIVLKLVGEIDWSWWWVLSPIWISWALTVVVVGLITTVSLLLAAGKKK